MRFRAAVAGVVLASGCSDPNFVPVRNPVASVSLVPQNDTLAFGGSVTLSAAPLDASGHPTIPDSAPVWTSLTPAVLTVNRVGHVQAIWFGTGQVEVRIDGIVAGTSIFVRDPPIDSVWVNPVNATLAVGDSIRFVAGALNAARLPAPLTGIVWRSSDPTRLTVDSTGLARAVAAGSALVMVTLAGYSDTSFVTIN